MRRNEGDIALIEESGIFDRAWYLDEYPDVRAVGMDPIEHYLLIGALLGRNPGPDFDTRGYLDCHPEAARAGLNPLVHFLRERRRDPDGAAATRSQPAHESTARPVPDARSSYLLKLETAYAASLRIKHSAAAIRTNLESRNAEIRALKLRLAELKVARSAMEGCALALFDANYPTLDEADRLKEIAARLERTGLVDADWYLKAYADVARAGIDPVMHYAAYGVREGRNPNAFFETGWYLVSHPAAITAGLNPAIHYHEEGWREGLDPSPRFATGTYLKTHGAEMPPDMNPLAHYLQTGRARPDAAPALPLGPPRPVDPVASSATHGAAEFRPVGPCRTLREYRAAERFRGISRFHGLSPEHLSADTEVPRPSMRLIPVSSEHNFIEIPPQNLAPRCILRIEVALYARERCRLVLRYATANDPRHDDEKCQAVEAEPGESTVSFELGGDHLAGSLRLSIETRAPIWLFSLRLKTAPRPARSGPLTSFVVPCFNHGDFIRETIDSIRAIPETNLYEIIVVDDGSTDAATVAALDALPQSGVRLVRQPNRGLGAARNNGIRQAAGRYILPVDADNRIRPAYFHRSVEMFETDPLIGVVYSDVQHFGDVNRRNSLSPHDPALHLVQNRIDACAAFRREVWEQVGGYQEEMIGYQDWEFWAAVDSLRHWKFYHMREVGFDYRVLSGSMVSHTRTFHEELVDFIAARHVRTLRNSHKALKLESERTEEQTRALGAPLVMTGRTDRPLVSVIAPNYNKAAYLRTRLDSIFKQTYRNFEVILLDDASNDGSVEILNEYAGRYDDVKTCYNEKNGQSVFAQWQKGIDLAEGELIWFAECDDYCDTSFLDRVVARMLPAYNIGLAYCQSNFVDESGEIIGNHTDVLAGLDRHLWTSDFVMEGPEFVRRFLRRVNCLPNASGVVFRRELLRAIDWNEVRAFAVCGDWWLWAKLLQHTNLHFCAEPMNFFRFDGNTARSSAMRALTRIHEHFRILEMIDRDVSLSEADKQDSLRSFVRGLQKHLDRFGAEDDQLAPLLRDIYRMKGPLSLRLPVVADN